MHANKKLFILRIFLATMLLFFSLYYATVENEISPYYSLTRAIENINAYDGKEIAFTGKVINVEQNNGSKMLRVSTMLEDGIKFRHAEFEAILGHNIDAEVGDSIDAVAVIENGKFKIKKAIFYRERNQKAIYLTSFLAIIISFIIFIDAMLEERE